MNKYRNNRYFLPLRSIVATTVMMFQAATKRMSVLLKRSYSTLPEAANAARTASTPHAVRLRRARKTPTTDAESDALPSGLTPTEFARYQRSLTKGELLRPDGTEPTEAEWLAKLNSRRSRLRGTREVVTPSGAKETRVVGEKVYLPNIIFRLVPNFTQPGKAYNPYEATFRIPQSVTKTDVRAYLAAVYGVQTTYIRTDNYFAPVRRAWNGAWVRAGRSYRTYKRAVVGLVEPFYYPMMPEDMSKADREAREQSLDQLYHIRARKDLLKAQLLRITRKNSAGWVWRGDLTTRRGTILKKIAEQRALREQFIQVTKERMRDAREQ
jgi:large subunit ribosomal protein L23